MQVLDLASITIKEKTIYDVLSNQVEIHEAVHKTNTISNLSIIPSTVDLSGIEPELANETDRAYVLKKYIYFNSSFR